MRMAAIVDGRKTHTAHDGRSDAFMTAPEALTEILTALEVLVGQSVKAGVSIGTPPKLQSCRAKFSAAI